MLDVSAEFLAEAVRDGHEPLIYMDIWPEKGPQRRLTSSSDWAGANDPAVAMDSNVSSTRKPGSLVLAQGVSSPLTGSAFYLVSHVMAYQIDVQSHWHTSGNWLTGTYLVHDYFSKAVVVSDPAILLPFTSTGTFLADGIRIVAQNTGNSATSVTIRILDNTGNQVGQRGQTAIAAGSGQVMIDVTGLAASLRKGARYQLEIGYVVPASPGVQLVALTSYTVNLTVSSYDITGYVHTIALSDGSGFVIGGQNGYQATGSAVRTLDVASVPAGTGTITFSDIVPAGADPTTMTVTLYYTDSAAIAIEPTLTNWTLHGVVASGDSIPAHRYWRAKIDMTSNSTTDETPEMHEIYISYVGNAMTFGNRMETALVNGATDIYQVSVYPGLDYITTASAQLVPKPSSSMVGRMSIIMLPDRAVNGLMHKKLRGRPVRIRAGYAALSETVEIYSGIVRDMTFNRGKYTLTAHDSIELADVSVPRTKAGAAWSSVADYAIGDTVIYGTNSWTALVASGPANGGAITPGTDPAVWQDAGTVWLDIGYTAATNGGVDWHLADIARDLIANRINIQSQHIDFASLDAMKTRWPNRTGTRTLTRPVKAFEMLSEIAWLLEAQWAVRGGQLTLIPESIATDLPVEFVSPDDVATGHGYRRGWADLKNESLIITGYSGSGTSDAQFSGGEAVADVTSISDYDMVALDTFRDKWNVPTLNPTSTPVQWIAGITIGVGAWITNGGVTYLCTVTHASSAVTEPGVGATWSSYYSSDELQTISTHFVYRWKNGRRVVTGCKSQMRLLRMEPGDVTMFDSPELPEGDPGPYKMRVLKKDLNWQRQHLTMSFIEVN